MTNNRKSIGFSITESCYELSKTVTYMPFELKGDKNLEAKAEASYAMAGVSCVFAYVSIESFVNVHLLRTWGKAYNLRDKLQHMSSQLAEIPRNILREFPTEESLGRFIRHKSTQKKLLLLCDFLGIPKINEAEPELWKDFKDLLKEFRDYVIHPKFITEDFQKHMKALLVSNKLGSYSSVARKIIIYFFKDDPQGPPEWLEKNRYFELRGIIIY